MDIKNISRRRTIMTNTHIPRHGDYIMRHCDCCDSLLTFLAVNLTLGEPKCTRIPIKAFPRFPNTTGIFAQGRDLGLANLTLVKPECTRIVSRACRGGGRASKGQEGEQEKTMATMATMVSSPPGPSEADPRQERSCLVGELAAGFCPFCLFCTFCPFCPFCPFCSFCPFCHFCLFCHFLSLFVLFVIFVIFVHKSGSPKGVNG